MTGGAPGINRKTLARCLVEQLQKTATKEEATKITEDILERYKG